MQNYRNVGAWAKAHALLLNVHRIIQRIPWREYASLRSQIRRSAESIPTNIVEGCGRASQKEFANYLQTSFSSANELEYHLRVAFDYGLIPERDWSTLTGDTIEVRKMLSGLMKRVRGKP